MQNNTVISESENSNFRRKQKDALRLNILEAASKLVGEGGPEALSLRKVAEEVGASTMVVYTVFGNKEGLLQALWQESFRRLWEMEEEALQAADPLLRLQLLGQAYRKNALDNPSFYKLVFQGKTPVSTAFRQEVQEQTRTFSVLIETIAACQADGKLNNKHTASDIAAMLWSTAHGVISLELNGMLGHWADPQTIFQLNFENLLTGLK